MRARGLVVLGMAIATLPACHREAAEEPVPWSITAWGEAYEIFAETPPLTAHAVSTSHTHVTVLADFSPLRVGVVEAVLRGPAGEEIFRQEQPKRDGIYAIDIKPSNPGDFELSFRVRSAAGEEEIAAGKVRVGDAGSAGEYLDPIPPEESQGVSFLKEQQWKTKFATAWTRKGALRDAVSGPGRILPAAGGEVVLTASVDSTVLPAPWPYRGLDVSAGATIFQLIPNAVGRTLPELQAQVAALEGEADVARRRVERLSELAALEAVSLAELERARSTAAGLDAKLSAARRDLDSTTASRTGTTSSPSLPLRAPWAGRIAEVSVSPGQSVAAGTALGRLVRTRPLWVEVALRPENALRLGERPLGLHLRLAGHPERIEIPASALRFVSRAPEIDPRTSTLAVTLQIDRSAADFPIGSIVEAELVLPGERPGIVAPDMTLVDDGGTAVVYIQLSGESFARREVRVLGREGSDVLLDGVREGERLVEMGGEAIRRATLLSSGAPEGHVH